MGWNYDDGQYHERRTFAGAVPAGKHRVRIAAIEECVSKSGRDMLKITLDVSGHEGKLTEYLVFMEDNPEFTNQKIGDIYNSFGIQGSGPIKPNAWIGRVGAANVKHENRDGNTFAKVAWFIKRTQQNDLPKWQDGSSAKPQPSQATPSMDYASMRDEDESFNTEEFGTSGDLF